MATATNEHHEKGPTASWGRAGQVAGRGGVKGLINLDSLRKPQSDPCWAQRKSLVGKLMLKASDLCCRLCLWFKSSEVWEWLNRGQKKQQQVGAWFQPGRGHGYNPKCSDTPGRA